MAVKSQLGTYAASVLALSLMIFNSAFAAPYKPKEIKIVSSDIKLIEIEYDFKGSTVSTMVACLGKATGLSIKNKGVLYFRSLNEHLKSVNADIKANSRNNKKLSSLKTKQAQVKALIKACANTCSLLSAPNSPTATPTPTTPSQPIPGSNPTPAPTASNQNFDSAGNVTEKGKALFKIPSNYQANIIRGQQAFNKYSCTGCHVERGGYDYTRITNGLTLEPMNSFGVSTQEAVDLVAWFNRGVR